MKETTTYQVRTKSVPSPGNHAEIGLPKHWEIKKLGDVCEKITNGANAKQFDENIGFPISRIETIWNQQIDLNRVKYIKENEKGFVEKYALKHNDILFSHINSDIHLGKTAVYKSVPKILIHGINLLLIRTNNSINPIYFNYYLHFLRARGKFISIAQKSVNQSSINQSKLKNVDIVVPPLPEQQAIVAKIEAILSELDNGKQQLLTAQQQLKVYRQSLLKWAFEGKLTNKDVMEGELPKGWKKVEMKEVTKKIQIGPFGTQLHKEDYIQNGVPLINPMHIQEGNIQPNYSYSITKEKRDSLPNYILQDGDVIMGRRGEMGRCGLVKTKETGWFCGTGSLYFRPDLKKLNPLFVYFHLTSKPVKKYLEENAGGTTMANLNLKIVNEIPIDLPPLREQQLIIDELESKLTVCDKIEETISQSLQQAETLRQSVLKRAFEGKLISQVKNNKEKASHAVI